MAHVVLVHGIAQEQQAADTLEATWLPALAGGVRTAGHPDLADRLWRSAHPGDLSCRMAYYGDLFRTPGAQGDSLGEPTPDDELAEQLAIAWLQAAAERGSARDQVAARQGLAALAEDQAGAQGPRAAVRPAMNALARVPWFAPFGLATAGRFVKRTLDQVTRYLTDDTVREQTIGRVLALIDDDTRLIVGHSLGSVVAYEALFHTEHTVYLITLGSPLGLRGAVYDRLRPQPPHTPPAVRSWTNIADVDDLVAATLDLRPLFPPGLGQLPIVHADRRADNGAQPHAAQHYLTKKSVGTAAARALTNPPFP